MAEINRRIRNADNVGDRNGVTFVSVPAKLRARGCTETQTDTPENA